MELSFSKYHGTGNDFILIDDREGNLSLSSDIITSLCHRQYGIGADGIILLTPSEEGDFGMQIFNRDGSEAEMCGNGLRCLVQFLRDLGEGGDSFQIETMKKIYPCMIEKGKIFVSMGIPKIVEEKESHFLLEVGVPHFVTFVDDLASFEKGAKKHFSSLGVNINYAKFDPCGVIYMRTFERGVEEETFSCGSGATAVCMAAWKRFGLAGPVDIHFHSGQQLQFKLITKDGVLQDLIMSGGVTHVFNGTMVCVSDGQPFQTPAQC
ncbi:diaminopimelate epimerase [Candidatus Neptunochlamydia vexilliferae]|uniref:diaminopimelate epimerase n=1 Tax=Candidatus Neptunichlamydia vexilliferae TaxID=1651774 RepID=UPI001891052D|nr:diaminopimelate epimerase [Candidatus Neptunochlamydia vexilliferae]